jgi:ABC-type molybdate transport system permease subunit
MAVGKANGRTGAETVMFAQSLGEYGALGSIASGVQQLAYSISASLHDVSATKWTIAAIALLAFVFWRRR